MTTRNKRSLAALNRENCEEHPRSNLAHNSSAPRSQEEYITRDSEEIEGRVTKRLSKEFSRTKNRILGALARLADFLMNPLLPGRSETTPEPSRNAINTSQGTNEDNSQKEETGVHEDVTYCPPSTSSGKQKKNRSTSQPQFRSENTPATIEADQILLALQQLANNNNSANFQNNINRISKLPKSLSTTMPTFDGKSEKN